MSLSLSSYRAAGKPRAGLLLLAALTSVSWLGSEAHAQSRAQTTVVLDFAVAPGLDPFLGRKAGDGLAVELIRSGDYEVVSRERLEEAVRTQAGLHPPFNDTTQIRLSRAVGANSVFSGMVVAASVGAESAQVQVNIRQLDARTGDYVNGTQIVETAQRTLSTNTDQSLLDEALNKASFSAIWSMKSATLPIGTVLNTTKNEAELSIGTRDGVAPGQRYTVLRDVFNRAKQVTERVKIGEIRVTRVEADQATAVLSAGGQAGVKTGDRIRRIFEPVALRPRL